MLTLASVVRVIADPRTLGLAEEFASDLAEATGLEMRIEAVQLGSLDTAASGGGILLHLDESDAHPDAKDRYLAEGYRLDIEGNGVTVRAPSTNGIFYGTRTLLQLLVQAPERRQLPIGSAVDWPQYASRGFSLDVGRRFFSSDFIRDYIKMMSYYKLNEFQLHLNDNEIHVADNDWTTAYSGFRLASENPAFAGLASADGAYTKGDWESFEETAAAHCVTVIPEIDGPAHAAAIIKWMPEIGRDGGRSDNLDLSKPITIQAMKDIFSEFTPWFRSPEVHFGADEYPRELKDDFRNYYNAMAEHLRSLGKQPRAWGSFLEMHGSVEGYDRDVVINTWNNSWYGPAAAQADGMAFITTNDAELYVVPFADYYHGAGLDNQALYDGWLPNISSSQTVSGSAPMGAMFAVWNDLVHAEYSELDVDDLVRLSFPTLAQKMWSAGTPALSYADFVAAVEVIGRGPGLRSISHSPGVRES